MSDLTVKNELTIPGNADDDFGELAHVRPKLIKAIVGQPTNESGFDVGKFNFNYSDKELFPHTDKLEGVVALKFWVNRVLYGRKGQPSRCSSSNSHEPSPRVEKPISTSCSNCPASGWDRTLDHTQLSIKRILETDLGKTAPSEKPLCTMNYNLLMIDHRMIPFVISASKTQIKNVEQNLITPLKYSGKRLIERTFDVSLVKSGAFYAFSFTNFRDTEDPVKFVEAYNFAREFGRSTVDSIHEKMDQDKEVGPSYDDEEIPF